MNKLIHFAGLVLLIAILVMSMAACGQPTVVPPATETPAPTPVAEPTKEVVVETPPPSPTPTPTPTPSVSVPPVAVTTVPMPMPSVSPTVAVTNAPVPTDASGNQAAGASPTVSPSAAVPASPTPTPYSYDAAFASTIMPDSVTIPEYAQDGYLNANGVNLRGGASDSAAIIGTYNSGTYVAILGTENGWTEVLIDGNVGYVRSNYVTSGYLGSHPGNGSAAPVVIGDGNGAGLVIVPDGPIVPSDSHNNSVITNAPSDINDGLDIYGGIPIG